MDDFTRARIVQFIDGFKPLHGKDPSKNDLIGEGISESDIKKLIRLKIIKKYSATVGSGSMENRYKLLVDSCSLNKI